MYSLVVILCDASLYFSNESKVAPHRKDQKNALSSKLLIISIMNTDFSFNDLFRKGF